MAARLRGPDRVQRIAERRWTCGATGITRAGPHGVRCPAAVGPAIRIGAPGCVGALAGAFCRLGAVHRWRSRLVPRRSRSHRAAGPLSGRARRSRRGDRRRPEQRRQASRLVVSDPPIAALSASTAAAAREPLEGAAAPGYPVACALAGDSCLLRRFAPARCIARHSTGRASASLPAVVPARASRERCSRKSLRAGVPRQPSDERRLGQRSLACRRRRGPCAPLRGRQRRYFTPLSHRAEPPSSRWRSTRAQR